MSLDWDAETFETITHDSGEFRVRLVYDFYPHEPWNDGGCPILRVDSNSWGGARFEHTGYGDYYKSGLDPERVLSHFAERFGYREGIEVFERYIHIFHEGSVETYHLGYSREYGYVTFTTRTLAREWGIPDDQPVPAAEMTEWRAYCEGEVYGYVVEKAIDWRPVNDEDGDDVMTTWEVVDSLWGFYGHESLDYMRGEATDALNAAAADAEVPA